MKTYYAKFIDDAKKDESFHRTEASIDWMLLPLVMFHSMNTISFPW